jgi:hypothetical protein
VRTERALFINQNKIPHRNIQIDYERGLIRSSVLKRKYRTKNSRSNILKSVFLFQFRTETGHFEACTDIYSPSHSMKHIPFHSTVDSFHQLIASSGFVIPSLEGCRWQWCGRFSSVSLVLNNRTKPNRNAATAYFFINSLFILVKKPKQGTS